MRRFLTDNIEVISMTLAIVGLVVVAAVALSIPAGFAYLLYAIATRIMG